MMSVKICNYSGKSKIYIFSKRKSSFLFVDIAE